jgi:hypothetical protein
MDRSIEFSSHSFMVCVIALEWLYVFVLFVSLLYNWPLGY